MISEATIFEVLHLGIKFMYRIQDIDGKFAMYCVHICCIHFYILILVECQGHSP